MALEQHSGYQIKDSDGNVRLEADNDGNITLKNASGVTTVEINSETGHIKLKGRVLNIQ